ncbi:hypothetical protein [Sulfitobacter sp. PS-8MA]|uniref:hypothetical protein n=1 Tax=Sulfitobacter sp. PS-8MA TaxID=3237707 RepID=UPI0034C6D06F
MTAMIRHHTTQAQIRAAESVPAFKLRNERYPDWYEDWYAEKMRKLAAKEGRIKPEPEKKEPPKKNYRTLDRFILKFIGEPKTAVEIAQEATSTLGYEVHFNLVLSRLKGKLSGKVVHSKKWERIKGAYRPLMVWHLRDCPPPPDTRPARPMVDMRGMALRVLSDGKRRTAAQIRDEAGISGTSKTASLSTALRHMCRDNILTRGKYGGCYEYQLAHVSCKDRIAAAKAEAEQ